MGKSYFIINCCCLGDCEESGFNNTQTGVDMRLQDIKDIILDPDNQLYVLCGSDGPGDVSYNK